METLSEDKIQASLFEKVWNQLPQTRRCLFSIPNGGTRNQIEAVKLRATGLVAGEPDLIFIWNGKAYGIEMKTSTGILSEKQILAHKAWKKQQTDVYIFRDSEIGFNLIKCIVENKCIKSFDKYLSL